MSEELTGSCSSQGINPRLRSTRRVRAVPYECCGGWCSLFNTGCFSMCCGPPKIKKRNSVSKKVKKNKAIPSPLSPENDDEQTDVQISESPKKLIIPNDDDGLTEEDRKEFNKSIPRQGHDEAENSNTDIFIIENIVELDEIPTRKDVDDEKDSAFSMNEDIISNKTDDVSISGSEVGTKKKKKNKLIGMLKIGKKKKNQDGISLASSSSSLNSKGIIEPSVSDHQWENLEAAKFIFQKCPVDTKSQENLDTVEEFPLREQFSHSSKDTIDGLKEESTVIHEDIETVDENEKILVEEDIIVKTEASIPLTTSALKQELNTNQEVENDDMVQSTENIKKKPFWKSAFKKDKSKGLNKAETDLESEKNTTVLPDAEKDKENTLKRKSFLGKWGSLKRAPTPSPSHDENQLDESKLIPQEEPESPSVELQGSELAIPDNETQNIEPKKRTLLRSLRLSKKEKTEKPIGEPECQHKCTETPCLFSVCVNSNVQPQIRKNSGDSLEVKTIDSYEGDSVGKNEAPIRIIRNQFFPAEIRDHSDEPVHNTDGINSGVEEAEQLEENTVVISDSKIEQTNETEVSSIIQEVNNTEDSGKNSSENAESPVLEKKYGVFDKEDFSESLHTLVDNESDEYIILAPTEAFLQTESSLKTADEKGGSSEISSSEILFRTSCRLSIEGSKENLNTEVSPQTNLSIDEPSNDEHSLRLEKSELGMNDSTEAMKNDNSEQISPKSESLLEVLTSTETLIEHSEDETILEKSTDTLTNPKESPDWVDVANIEDLSDSKFNYIYKTTVRGVNGDKTHHIKDDSEQTDLTKIEDEAYSSTHSDSSCEKCGQLLEDNGSNEEIKCVCGTLTRARDSVLQLEEGNVMKKVAAFNESEHPIIVPIISVDHVGAITDKDDVTISEAHSSPSLGSKSGSKSATPSPIAAKSRSGTLSSTNSEWQNAEEDIDRMMVIQGRSSLSSLGLRSDSMASVYSGAGEGRYGTVTVRGHVEFGLQYNYKAGALEIHVKQCKDLAPVDTKRNRSDPYVKVYLLPDKSKGGKRKTKVKKHTLNPVFDETLKFHISLNGLETRTLWLTVWHSDMFGRNDFLGEVMMALENKVFDDPTPKLYNLQERTEPFDDTLSFKGDIIVCLKFVPPDMTVQKKGKRSRGTLHVLVKEAKYLTAYKANGTSDPFCKSYLLPDKGRNSKQKTPVIKKTVNPVWNHTFVYDDVTLQELAERCLELTVWDHDRLASNEFLGGVRFSMGTVFAGKHYGKSVEWMDATGKEMTLWKSMLERPNFWVEGCLSLRPTLDARTS